MLKIRLSRFGKRGQPTYRIVVKEARSKRDSNYLDLLGVYNPLTKPASFTINRQKYDAWLQKGAQPTQTVKRLVNK